MDQQTTIPVLDIDGKGWTVDDITTIEQCDDAFAYLTAAVANIEGQIEMATIERKDLAWLIKAKTALRYKRAAMQIVQNKRGAIKAAEKRAHAERLDAKLLHVIRASVSDEQFLEWVSLATA